MDAGHGGVFQSTSRNSVVGPKGGQVVVRSSRYSRLQTINVLVALCASALVAMVVSAPAGAVVYAKKIALRVVNNSPYTASFRFCATGHVNISYEFGQVADPCLRTPFIVPYVDANGGRYPSTWPSDDYTGNPVAVIVQLNGGGPKLFLYAKNPTLNQPFFQVSEGSVSCSAAHPCFHHRYHMSQGELRTVQVGGIYVRFHREGDWTVGDFPNSISYKLLTMEICGTTPGSCYR